MRHLLNYVSISLYPVTLILRAAEKLLSLRDASYVVRAESGANTRQVDARSVAA